jgi:glycosyltransferase involved in cell wall biosynthesis
MQLIALEQTPSSQCGGQELNLYEISSALAQRGHSITLVYLEEGDLLQKYKLFCKNIIAAKRYGVKEKTVGGFIQFSLELLQDIKKIPVSDDSVIFCNDFSSVFFGSVLSRLRGIPLIHYIQLPAYEFKFKWRPGLSKVDHFIAVSKQTKDSWVKLGIPETKASVVYNGIDTNKFKPSDDLRKTRSELNIPDDAMIVSYVGRLNPEKGIEVLIKAVAMAVGKGIKMHLFIAGNPRLDLKEDSPEARIRYKQSLEQLVVKLGAGEFVHFLGHVPNTVMLYQASDVNVVPSVWPDPCPRVVIEALATGTPVVASSIGGITEQLMPTFQDWLFEPGNHVQLLEVLLTLKDWRCSRPSISEQCRQHIFDNFSYQKMMDEIERILLDTVKS